LATPRALAAPQHRSLFKPQDRTTGGPWRSGPICSITAHNSETDTAMTKTLVQEQFGRTAQHYLTSAPHAKGASLDKLVALTRPRPEWRVLDIATGAGHTAYAFAPHVARVWATDITDEMMDVVRKEAGRRNLSNIRVTYAKAEALPFEDASFDCVTSRIAPHHFDSIPDFLSEVHRVLKPGGVFALVDNIAPEGAVGDFVNGFERLRDPSHLRAWDMPEWHAALKAKGFVIEHEEVLRKTIEFESWAGRHDATMKRLLRGLLREANASVQTFLEVSGADDALTFRLAEGLFICRKP
jgi:ubiquinone/menaquinone biosynthesis C-methylase UbiE